MSQLRERLSFFVATDRLKETQRANWLYTEPSHETVAEHVWHTSLLAMLLQDTAPDGVDHSRVRDLLIIHDLVEVFAGDTFLYDDVPLDDVTAREHAAGERLMAMLPDDQYERLDPLWHEFQAQLTAEARFARAIDALHPMVMSWFPSAAGHLTPALTPTKILTRKRPAIESFPALWSLANWLVQQAVDQGLISGDEMVSPTPGR